MAQPPSRFGEIPGNPPGTTYATREQVRGAGLHRHEMAGISGQYEDGADAIIVSGGYVDDHDDGDTIIYTGQGGQDAKKRQVADQTLTRGNLALARSEEDGLPVRVIRGAKGDPKHSPKAGYRYDGLYVVTSHWQEHSVDGPLIWRFTLEKTNDISWQVDMPTAADGSAGTNPDPGSAPEGQTAPPRTKTVVQRVVRNTAVAQWVKSIHGHACQVCGQVLETPAGHYAEGAHIRPLGDPHNGPDVPSNILCLCPNHHVLLDKGSIYVEDGQVHSALDGSHIGTLRGHPRHHIDPAYVLYHRSTFARGEPQPLW